VSDNAAGTETIVIGFFQKNSTRGPPGPPSRIIVAFRQAYKIRQCIKGGIIVTNFYWYSLLPILVVGLAIVLASSEIGWQLGLRAKGRGRENMPALEQSVLALLAWIIGFTFFMALTRYESRREAILNEANAIGTTALRARLLPDPHRTTILKLLREYAQIRVDYIGRGLSFAQLPEVIQRITLRTGLEENGG
jgi:hypothetical protein